MGKTHRNKTNTIREKRKAARQQMFIHQGMVLTQDEVRSLKNVERKLA